MSRRGSWVPATLVVIGGIVGCESAWDREHRLWREWGGPDLVELDSLHPLDGDAWLYLRTWRNAAGQRVVACWSDYSGSDRPIPRRGEPPVLPPVPLGALLMTVPGTYIHGAVTTSATVDVVVWRQVDARGALAPEPLPWVELALLSETPPAWVARFPDGHWERVRPDGAPTGERVADADVLAAQERHRSSSKGKHTDLGTHVEHLAGEQKALREQISAKEAAAKAEAERRRLAEMRRERERQLRAEGRTFLDWQGELIVSSAVGQASAVPAWPERRLAQLAQAKGDAWVLVSRRQDGRVAIRGVDLQKGTAAPLGRLAEDADFPMQVLPRCEPGEAAWRRFQAAAEAAPRCGFCGGRGKLRQDAYTVAGRDTDGTPIGRPQYLGTGEVECTRCRGSGADRSGPSVNAADVFLLRGAR